ncbi:MAG: DUF2085 domain-containing protein [Balneola sp.]
MYASLQFNNRVLYTLVLIGTLLLVIIALGPGLFSNPTIFNTSWQFKAFHFLCHQDPARSFIINNSQMAVCARCIGIYGAFLAGVILMPFVTLVKEVKFRYYFRLMLGTIILNLIDVLGNQFEFWTNTNESRLILGFLFGMSTAFILSNEFFKKLNTEE